MKQKQTYLQPTEAIGNLSWVEQETYISCLYRNLKYIIL